MDAIGDFLQGLWDAPGDAVDAVIDTGDAMQNIGEGMINFGKGFNDSVDGFGRLLGMFPIVLLCLFALLLFVTFSMRSFSKARNNPHALQRLQIIQDHEVRSAIAAQTGVDPMKKF